MSKVRTAAEMISALKEIEGDFPIEISFRGGGDIIVERRDLVSRDGTYRPVIAIYNSNGGKFGNLPLTEDIYATKSLEFLRGLCSKKKRFTTIHGDYRLYSPMGWNSNDTCYGTSYDPRIIHRMVTEGLLEFYKQDFSIDGVRATDKGLKHV